MGEFNRMSYFRGVGGSKSVEYWIPRLLYSNELSFCSRPSIQNKEEEPLFSILPSGIIYEDAAAYHGREGL